MWIFDAADGSARLLRSREGHSAPPHRVRFYPDGERDRARADQLTACSPLASAFDSAMLCRAARCCFDPSFLSACLLKSLGRCPPATSSMYMLDTALCPFSAAPCLRRRLRLLMSACPPSQTQRRGRRCCRPASTARCAPFRPCGEDPGCVCLRALGLRCCPLPPSTGSLLTFLPFVPSPEAR